MKTIRLTYAAIAGIVLSGTASAAISDSEAMQLIQKHNYQACHAVEKSWWSRHSRTSPRSTRRTRRPRRSSTLCRSSDLHRPAVEDLTKRSLGSASHVRRVTFRTACQDAK